MQSLSWGMWDLVPWPGVEPGPSAQAAWSLSHWTTREVPISVTLEQKESEVAQSCPTLCNPIDCSLPGSSVHGIFQVLVLDWIAVSFSRGSSQPRDWTQVSRIVDRRFTIWATREVLIKGKELLLYSFYEASITLRQKPDKYTRRKENQGHDPWWM